LLNIERILNLHADQSRDHCPQGGFTLIEVAIVLIIVGLLLGAILKATALIDATKVRRIADLTSAAQVAYLGFVDRYQRIPGDWSASAASAGIGTPVTGGGNDNNVLDNPPGFGVWVEPNALWEQLAKAKFISGRFGGAGFVEPDPSNDLAPVNPFGGVLLMARSPDVEGTAEAPLQLILGRALPVDIAREIDLKLDDGFPDQGSVRATLDDGSITTFVGTNRPGGREATCIDGTPVWNVNAGSQDCNAAFLF